MTPRAAAVIERGGQVLQAINLVVLPLLWWLLSREVHGQDSGRERIEAVQVQQQRQLNDLVLAFERGLHALEVRVVKLETRAGSN